MKIYFTASQSQKDALAKYYSRIFDFLKNRDFDVETGSLFSSKTGRPQVDDHQTRVEWYKKSMKSISEADVVVVEISYPSTANVGHELTYALEKGKPVIALFHEDRDPVFLMGLNNDKLLIVSYRDDNLEKVAKDALDFASGVQDTRFNFFVAPKHQHYMDWIAKNRRVPRAVFLRRLIEKAMEEEPDYEG